MTHGADVFKLDLILSNALEYINVMTTGNPSDFGDLSASKYNGAGASDAHGGLGL